MQTKCEVIGWLLVDDSAQVMVREANGRISRQTASLASTFGHQAIQTGTFRRGNAIVDPVTHQTLGYEMEELRTPFETLV